MKTLPQCSQGAIAGKCSTQADLGVECGLAARRRHAYDHPHGEELEQTAGSVAEEDPKTRGSAAESGFSETWTAVERVLADTAGSSERPSRAIDTSHLTGKVSDVNDAA